MAKQSETLVRALRIVNHDCYEDKNKDGSPRRSFSVEAAYEFGQPAVRLYISPEEARALADATGNGFTREERAGKAFQVYDAVGEFDLTTRQVVRRGDNPSRDRVNNQLGVKALSIRHRASAA